jgi:uncharacterized protein
VGKQIIGMLHLPALPGAPRYGGDPDALRDKALADARALVDGGVSAILIENFGDVPFLPGPVPPAVVAHITALAADVRSRFQVPLGINVLRNDGCAALSIAHAVGAQFIRVNILGGARLTDQGIISGIAHDLLRLRKILGAGGVQILADVDVKHSAPLAAAPLEQEVEDLIQRGGADGLIVTGSGTGKAAALEDVRRIRSAAGRVPLFIGSGVTQANAMDYLPHVEGVIVGSSLRSGGPGSPVDPQRVRSLVDTVTRASRRPT